MCWNSKYFALLDLAHGYHQIILSDQASSYTNFIVSAGKGAKGSRFLHALTGLNVKGDYFNYHIATVFTHLPGITKLVYDLLIPALTWGEFVIWFKNVMEVAR